MKLRSLSCSLLAVCCLPCVSSNANAGFVLLEFSGEIDAFSNVVAAGTPFNGTMRYDSDTPPINFTTFYRVPDFSFTIGANEYSQISDDHRVQVAKGVSGTLDILSSFNGVFTGPSAGGLTIRSGAFDLRDSDGTMLASTALPASLDFSKADYAQFRTSWGAQDSVITGTAYGRITSFSITAVPEPGSAVLLACAGVGLALRRRRTSTAC